MIIYQFCLLSLAPFPYLPALLDLHDDDDDVGCSQTGHVGSGFGTCRRARGARRIVSACARLFISSCLPFPTLCVCVTRSTLNNHRKMTIFRCFARDSYPPLHTSPLLFPISPSFVLYSLSQTLLTLSGFVFLQENRGA